MNLTRTRRGANTSKSGGFVFMKNGVVRTSFVALLLMMSSAVFGGVVGGPQERKGELSANRYQEFTFEFRKNEDCWIRAFFEEVESPEVCRKLKLKILVDGEWMETIPAQPEFDPFGGNKGTCDAEAGYGGGSLQARKNHNVTIQVINESSKRQSYILKTN